MYTAVYTAVYGRDVCGDVCTDAMGDAAGRGRTDAMYTAAAETNMPMSPPGVAMIWSSWRPSMHEKCVVFHGAKAGVPRYALA